MKDVFSDYDVIGMSEKEIREKFVGRIDYLDFSGKVVEKIYFATKSEYEKEINDSYDIGRPISTENF